MMLEDALAACPVLAIIRGVRPDEAVAVGEALYEAGLRGVEVPLNSPDALESVFRLAKAFEGRMTVGAGTVLAHEQVRQVYAAGGTIIISPNTNPDVIRTTIEVGMNSLPGIATPTEAFTAIDAGARHLKLFPAATYGPGHVRQIRAVLPSDVTVWAVGGAGSVDFPDWWAAGVRAFGVGSELYKPGMAPDAVFERAKAVVGAATSLT